MRLAVFGDIHGNAVALQAVLSDMEALGVDRKVCLGDIAFRGPQPEESCALLSAARPDAVVAGNGDQWLTLGAPPGFRGGGRRTEELERFRDWALDRLRPESLAYLRTLPLQHTLRFGPHTVVAVHASPRATTDVYPASAGDETLAGIFAGAGPCDTLVYGHIHTPFVRRVRRHWLVNAGSVGFPVDGDYRATYALLELAAGGLNISIRRVPYDVGATAAAAHERDFPHRDAYIACLRAGHALRL